MNPKYPLYIPSKGRAESRLTSRALDAMGVPYRIVIEEQEWPAYSSQVPENRLLILDRAYQRNYETCDSLGDTKSKGPGPARNFIWEHAISEGYPWHWVMDDNIRLFLRFNKNLKVPVKDGTIFRCMEDFCERYKNVAMAGPQYFRFIPRKAKTTPVIFNTRIYSCNLIRNDIPYRWRGRYNEDTDLSLRVLKDGWCTVQFNSFLSWKEDTNKIKGGNTEAFYAKEGTRPKSEMQVKLHPDVSRIVNRFGRFHHYVNYRPFKKNRLILRDDITIPEGTNNYGMRLVHVDEASVRATRENPVG
jgi:hypothetical protein